jgi:hypothetical protein
MSNIGSLMWYVHLISIEVSRAGYDYEFCSNRDSNDTDNHSKVTMMLMVFRDPPYLPSSFLAVVRNYSWMLLGSLYFLVGHKEHCEERGTDSYHDNMTEVCLLA